MLKAERVEKWMNHGLTLHGLTDSVTKLLGSAPESPINDIPWRMFEDYTEELARHIGEDNYASVLYDLNWFAWECDLGRKPMTAINGGHEIEVKDLKSFLVLLEISEKESGHGKETKKEVKIATKVLRSEWSELLGHFTMYTQIGDPLDEISFIDHMIKSGIRAPKIKRDSHDKK